jgi:putative transposase
MARERHTPEQIVAMLRQIEGEVANSKPTPQACREAGITEQTYYRWRKEHGGLKLEQARRLKELEKENTRLRRGGGRPFPGEASAETPLTPPPWRGAESRPVLAGAPLLFLLVSRTCPS